MTEEQRRAVSLARSYLAGGTSAPYHVETTGKIARALVEIADELTEFENNRAALAATMTYGPRDRQG